MKKLLGFIISIIIVTSLFGSYLSRTNTMDESQFQLLYDACDEQDEVMEFYWNNLVDGAVPNPVYRYEEDNDWQGEKASYELINYAGTYADNSLIGALAVNKSNNDAKAFLNGAKDYLIYNPESGHHDLYLSLDSLWVEFGYHGNLIPGGDVRDCLNLGYLLTNITSITDMLWFYVDDSTRIELYNKLEDIAKFAYLIIKEHSESDVIYTDSLDVHCENYYPKSLVAPGNNIRIILATSLGYAGCILNNEEFVSTAENELFIHNYDGKNGLIGLNTTGNKTYSEGMAYSEMIAPYLGFFLSARRRVTIDGITKNWFELSEDIQKYYESSLKLTSPEFARLGYDDSYLCNIGNDGSMGSHSTPNSAQQVTYYYQCDNDETRKNITWLQKGWESSWYNTNNSLSMLYSYFPGNNIHQESMPIYAKTSYMGNEEFSILSPSFGKSYLSYCNI